MLSFWSRCQILLLGLVHYLITWSKREQNKPIYKRKFELLTIERNKRLLDRGFLYGLWFVIYIKRKGTVKNVCPIFSTQEIDDGILREMYAKCLTTFIYIWVNRKVSIDVHWWRHLSIECTGKFSVRKIMQHKQALMPSMLTKQKSTAQK